MNWDKEAQRQQRARLVRGAVSRPGRPGHNGPIHGLTRSRLAMLELIASGRYGTPITAEDILKVEAADPPYSTLRRWRHDLDGFRAGPIIDKIAAQTCMPERKVRCIIDALLGPGDY